MPFYLTDNTEFLFKSKVPVVDLLCAWGATGPGGANLGTKNVMIG